MLCFKQRSGTKSLRSRPMRYWVQRKPKVAPEYNKVEKGGLGDKRLGMGEKCHDVLIQTSMDSWQWHVHSKATTFQSYAPLAC